MQITIQPIQFFRKTATILKVDAVQVRNLGENGTAIILYSLLSSDGENLSNGSVMLQGSEYSSWGSDDSYILNYVLNQLEITV